LRFSGRESRSRRRRLCTLRTAKTTLDPLIEKFQCDQIDDAELVEFKRMLREIVEDEAQTAFHRKNARDVLTLIKIRYEIASDVAAV
jgi:hypothetical protein